MSKLDDQLVIRMTSGQRKAIKEAAEMYNISEGAIVRRAINLAIEQGRLEPPLVFAPKNHGRDQNTEESDR
jgi:hypothetical protein